MKHQIFNLHDRSFPIVLVRTDSELISLYIATQVLNNTGGPRLILLPQAIIHGALYYPRFYLAPSVQNKRRNFSKDCSG